MPLTLHRLDNPHAEDYSVLDDGVSVGRIFRDLGPNAQPFWSWNITFARPLPGARGGKSDSLEDAKLKLKARWLYLKATISPEDYAKTVRLQEAAGKRSSP